MNSDCLLEFEREAFLNIINQTSLTISSKALLTDRLLFNLVKTYCRACHLVLVIGTDSEEEDSILSQISDHVTQSNPDEDFLPPKRLTFVVKEQNRRDFYMSGGVIFVTSRILVVDMLKKQIPIHALSGIIVVNAHRISSDCHMAFILRLFRQENKSGFITCISQNSSKFIGSFAQLERCMRMMFVNQLHLWPRFHSLVSQSFSTRKPPKVTELRIEMTSAMRQIQFGFIELISMIIKELKNMSSFVHLNTFDSKNQDQEKSLSTINVIANNFISLIRANLDSVWYQLSDKARRFILDIKQLKSLLFHLTQLDAVAFYAELEYIRSTPAEKLSDWFFWTPTDSIFKLAKDRIFHETQQKIEINPKLDALMNLLDEIEKKIIDKKGKHSKSNSQSSIDDSGENVDQVVDIVIIVENNFTIFQIETFRDKGRDEVMKELKNKCEMISSGKKMELFRKMSTIPENQSSDDKKNELAQNEDDKVFEFDDQVTLTQMLGKLQNHEKSIVRKRHLLDLHYYEWSSDSNCGLRLKRLLSTLRPQYVILYDPDVSSIRQIELFQAIEGKPEKSEIEVYFFIFDGSAEEQRYLRNLQVEKESFEKLIEEKSRLPNVTDINQIDGMHADLIRGVPSLFHPDEEKSSRVGGNRSNQKKENAPREVLIDVREFRSKLPECIHKIGIDLVPVTLDIGDYVITPNSCIERKSISDLIGSLNNGRLYFQSQMMIRHYERPILLIEFDDPKEFNFKGRIWAAAQTSNTNQKPSPLLQLAVLTIHFPLLRIIWSPSPNFSANIIDELKQGKDEPTEKHIIRNTSSKNSEELPIEYLTDRYDIETKEFLLCLPGITTQNVYSVMNRCQTIADLVGKSIEELTEILNSKYHADLLWSGLHDQCVFEDDKHEIETKKTKDEKRFKYTRVKPKK